MHCGKRELCYFSQNLYLFGGGESNLGVIENSLMSLHFAGSERKCIK